MQVQEDEEENKNYIFKIHYIKRTVECRIAWSKGCLKAKDSQVLAFSVKYSHKNIWL
jgi:hypothetical protein